MLTLTKIKEYYEKGLWDESRLQLLVDGGVLTEEQYQEIIGADE